MASGSNPDITQYETKLKFSLCVVFVREQITRFAAKCYYIYEEENGLTLR